ATARSARLSASEFIAADTLATLPPTNTRSDMSSLSADSVPSTLPRRTETLLDRERITTASAASAPARFAASTSWATRSTRNCWSEAMLMGKPLSVCEKTDIHDEMPIANHPSTFMVAWKPRQWREGNRGFLKQAHCAILAAKAA